MRIAQARTAYRAVAPGPLLGFPRMSERQLYRLRAPSTGRELLVPAEPGKVYTRPRHGRAARGRREGASAAPVEVQPAMGGRDAAVLQLVRPARPEGPQRLPDVRPPDGRAAPLRGGRMRLAPRGSPYPSSCSPSPSPAAAAPPSPSRRSRATRSQLTVPGNGEGARARGDRRRRPPRPPRPPSAERRARPPRRPTRRRDAETQQQTTARRHDRGRRRGAATDDSAGDRPGARPPGPTPNSSRTSARRTPAPAEPASTVPQVPATAADRPRPLPVSGKAQSPAHRTGHQG